MPSHRLQRGAVRSQSRRISVIGDRLLTLMAVVGAVSLVLVILSLAFQVSILKFRTGSMSPTIPAGSIAIAREIPAAAISPGDIVTVDRGGDALPITHRVVSITHSDPATGNVIFRMRGDANDAIDPRPYTATEVKLVMISIPVAARVIQWFDSPFTLGSLTLAATLLVGWAFWPRDDDEQGDADATHAGESSPSSALDGEPHGALEHSERFVQTT